MKPIRLPAGAALAATVLTATLGGCHALPPLHYYALQAVAPAASSPPTAATPLLLRIRHVGVPHEMDHLGLTHRQGAAQLAISDTERWSAPLADLIQGTLTHDLGTRLGFAHVVAVDALATHGSVPAALDLDFVALSADDSCNVSAQVNWTLSGTGIATRRGSVALMATAAGCRPASPAPSAARSASLPTNSPDRSPRPEAPVTPTLWLLGLLKLPKP